MQDTSYKIIRRYWQSSSFQMALFFTTMLSVSGVIIGFFLYDFSQEIPAHLYNRFQNLSFVIMALMSIVALVSFLISHFVVSRINIIAKTAHQIMQTGDLTQRIEITTKADDLSNLAQILNEFLTRMEVLMSGIRDVSDNIAHDLRTPLTHLRHQIEELKTNLKEENIDTLLNEADRILDVFSSLLRISNIEKGKRILAFESVNLSELLNDVIELYEPLGEEKGIIFSTNLTENITTLGDKNLLFQLFANILSNAIKFAPPQSLIEIIANNESVIINDNGIGIPEGERLRVFERFYRVDNSRTLEGNGLGLTLVKAIAELHNGEIVLSDNQPGLRVSVFLQKFKF